MNRTEPQQIGDIIQDVFVRAGQKDNADRYRALVNWGNIVGGGVNSITTRRYVTGQGIMHVYISSASVKQELMFRRERLVKELNVYAGTPDAIKELVIH